MQVSQILFKLNFGLVSMYSVEIVHIIMTFKGPGIKDGK